VSAYTYGVHDSLSVTECLSKNIQTMLLACSHIDRHILVMHAAAQLHNVVMQASAAKAA